MSAVSKPGDATPPGRSPTPDSNPVSPALRGQELQAPWRLQYLEELSERERQANRPGGAVPTPGTGSFLRDYWLTPSNDESNHVILRHGDGDCAGMILLNGFPYANGHLLVALGDPRGDLLDYSPSQRAALWRCVDLAALLMRETLQPQGINIGVNQGRAAGAGVPQHLHVHLVPRWGGDVNFMTVVGRIRIMPSSLEHMWARYRQTWERLHAEGCFTPS